MTIERIPYMKSFILLIIMESGFFTNGLRGFPVFTVDVCPSNITEWDAASMRLNCTMKSNDFKNRYHCVATRDRSQLVEFCYPHTRSIYGKGQCVIFDSSFFLDNYTCLHFTDGCPDTYYFTDQLYKFPNCFHIEPVLKCFMAEELCLKKKRLTTTEHKEVSTSQTIIEQHQTTEVQEGLDSVTVLVPSIILPGIVLGFALFILMLWRTKRCQGVFKIKRLQDNVENDNNFESIALLNNPDTSGNRDDDKEIDIFIDKYQQDDIIDTRTKHIEGFKGQKSKNHDDQLSKGRSHVDMTFCKPLSLQRTDLEKMIDTTKRMLVQFEMDIRDFFVTTRASEKVYKVLEKTRCVFVKGNPGDGKTTIAKHILFTLMKEKKVLPLQMLSLNNFYEMVPSCSRIAIFLDNMFGERSVSRDEIQYFNAQKDLIKTILSENDDGNGNFFIATLRNEIYLECELTIMDINVFKDVIVDLSDTENRINREEFENFVSKYKLHDATVSVDEILNSRNLGCTIGIPQCFEISKKIAHENENISDVFKNPFEHLKKEIMLRIEDKEHKTAVLIYILLCGGSVKNDKMIYPKEDREKKKKSLRILELKESASSLSHFQDSVRFYEGSYIYHDNIDNEYRFTHSSIQECLFLYLCQHYPEDILSTCDPSLFLSLTTTKKLSNSIIVSKDLFPVLIERIIVILKERKFSEYKSISYMTLWADDKFSKEVMQNNKCIQIMKDNVDNNDDSILVHFSGAGHVNWVVYLLSCSSEKQIYRSLNRACMHNRMCVSNLILETNIVCDLKTCFYAVQSGNIELLFKCADRVDLSQTEISNHPRWSSLSGGLLQEICLFGQNDFIEPVLKRYPLLLDVRNSQGVSALHCVAFAGQKDAFEMLINNGSDPYSKSHYGSTVLHFACQNGKIDMVRYICDSYPNLLSFDDYEGHSPLHFAAQSGNIESYNYLLEKGVETSLTNCNDTPLAMACYSGQLEMCEYLVKLSSSQLHFTDNLGKSVLFNAASRGYVDIFNFFIKSELDVNRKSNEGKTVLHLCCRNGTLEMCKYLVKNYPKLLNVIDNDGYTVLHDAAKGENIDIFSFLLSIGMDVNDLTNDGKCVLHISCQTGHLEIYKYLVEKYPKLLDVKDNNGYTVLHYAGLGGNVDLLKLLIDKKLDINTTTNTGKTVLHQCCINGKLEMCKYVVKNYPNLLNVIDNDGYTVLHDAAKNGKIDLFSYLLSLGMDAKDLTKYGKSVLHISCQRGHLDLCKYLVENFPALFEVKDKNGCTVLHDAGFGGNVDVLKLLIDKGLDLKSTTNIGKTVLHYCCVNGKLEMCKYLVTKYPDLLNVFDNDGLTILHDAAKDGNFVLFSYLLSVGMNVNDLANNGESVLHTSCRRGHLKLCKVLVEKYPELLDVKDQNGCTVLHYAGLGGNVDVLKLLIGKGLDVQGKTTGGKTVLHLCCLNGELKMCKYVVKNYPNLLNVIDNDGFTVLHDAAKNGKIDLFSYLLTLSMNAKDLINNGKSVLHILCQRGHLDLCKYLVEKYPELLDVKDKNGCTILHYAGLGGNVDVLKLLIGKGLDVKGKTTGGKTVLHLCCIKGDLKMCKYLVKNYPDLLNVIDSDGYTVLHDAAKEENLDLFSYLITLGMNAKDRINNGKSVLHISCQKGHLELSQYLVENFPVLFEVKDKNGCTVLHDAGFGGNVDVFKLLIGKGLETKTTTNDGKTVLNSCCLNGKLEMCKYLVTKYPDLLNVIDNDGFTVLHDAAKNGNLDLFSYLLTLGMNVNDLANNGESVLHTSCRRGHLNLCKYLVEKYPELLDVKNNNGCTVLHYAGLGRNVDVLKLWIGKGLDVKGKTNEGKTVLHLCCMNGELELCKYLVKNYPDLLNVIDSDGYTVLHDAAKEEKLDLFSYLITLGMNAKDLTNNGKSVLHISCQRGHLELCKYIVEKFPALFEVKDKYGCTVLHDAGLGGNVDVFKLLIDKGLDIKTTTNDGKTVLHNCCLNGKLELCKYLVTKYPDLLNVIDNDGFTVLHDAAKDGNFVLFSYLLGVGMNANDLANGGESVLHISCRSGHLELCKYLVEKYPELLEVKDKNGCTVLHYGGLAENVDVLKFLIDKGLDIKTTTNDGKTVLHNCCLNGKLEICKYLVTKYPDLLNVIDNDGFTVLHDAAKDGNFVLFSYLLGVGMNANDLANGGESVLHTSCRSGHLELCKFLVEKHPALLDVKDKNGCTVLHYAGLGGNVDVLKLLIGKGLDVKGKTNEGKTVLHLCCINGKLEIGKYLVAKYPELLNVIDNDGFTVLHDAAKDGNFVLFSYLLSVGMNANDLANNGESVLHTSCSRGHLELCRYIVEKYPALLDVKDKNGCNVLHYAGLGGNVDVLKLLIGKGLDVKGKTTGGKTVLHLCCMNGELEMCKYLVKNYPDLLNVIDSDGYTVLHDSAKEENLDLFSYLITLGMNAKDLLNNGQSVLHISCQRGHLELCQYIVENFPALFEVKDINGCTVLHDAGFGGNVDVFKLLIDKGLDLKSTTYIGKTVLHYCCFNGKLEMCKYLVTKYPDLLNVIDNDGFTVLHDAAKDGNLDLFSYLLTLGMNVNDLANSGESVLHTSCRRGHLDLCKYLVEKYPELLDVKDKNGCTVLHYAGLGRNVDVLKLWIGKGLDVKGKTNEGKTVLHLCCMNGELELCKYLVKNYPDLLNIIDSDGYTVLHDAAKEENLDLFSYLITLGMNAKDLTNNGKSVLHISCQRGHLELCKYIVEKFPALFDVKDINGCTVLHDAGFGGNVDVFKLLMGKGLETKTTTNDGKTVLHNCCLNGKLEMCKYLVTKYPDLLNVIDNDGFTVLHDAAKNGNLDLFSYLLTLGMNVNDLANNGESVLHTSCLRGHLELCRYLVEKYPALLDVKDKNGCTVLHYAGLRGNVDVFKLLIDKGLDLKSTTYIGKTVLHYSCVNGKLEMCKYLVTKYPDLLNVIDNDGYTVLHDAAKEENLDLFSYLITLGMNANDLINNGKSVLHISCQRGHLELSKYLVEKFPALFEVKDKNGCTVLHDAGLGGNVDVLKLLIRKGLDVKSKTNEGKTVLHLCCMNGEIEMCKYLVKKHPELVGIRDIHGDTILPHAACAGNVDLFKLVTEIGFDVKNTTNKGKTVLHLCCMNSELEMCKYLVKTYPDLLSVIDNDGHTALHDTENIDLFSYLITAGMNVTDLTNDGKSVLHISCCKGNAEMCTFLVKNYPKLLEEVDNSGFTVLHGASFGGNFFVFKFLIAKGLKVENTIVESRSVLHFSCMNGKFTMSKFLIRNYPHLLDMKDIYNENVLPAAAWGGNVNLFKFLTNKGLGINSSSTYGKSMLHWSCRHGKIEMSRYLAFNYPDSLVVIDNDGMNVLHDAAFGGNVKLFEFLIDKGLDVNNRANNGKTVLHWCCRNGEQTMFNYLNNKYPHFLHMKDDNNENVLHDAAWGGNVNLLKIVIEEGLDVDSKTKKGKTVLHQSCRNGKLSMCKYLDQIHPELVKCIDNDGGNLLHDAAWGGNVEVFKFVLVKGLDVYSKTKKGKTILHQSCMNGKVHMCKYLIDQYPDLLEHIDNDGESVLHDAACGGNIYLLNLLIDKGLDVNRKTTKGKTVLHKCCINCKVQMCKYLVNHQQQLLTVQDNDGVNALHDTAIGGDVELLKFLLEKGLDVNGKTGTGQTVLHLSCHVVKNVGSHVGSHMDKQAMFDYLIESYPDLLNVVDYEGNTVLHVACTQNQTKICGSLVEKFPDLLNIENKNGEKVVVCLVDGEKQFKMASEQ